MMCKIRRSLMASLLVLATFSLKDAAAQSGLLTTAEATALLARIHAIDIKCQVLSASDSDDLYQLLLGAEVLLAKKTSLKEAQAAVAEGKTAAARCTCDDADQALVVSTFALARVVGTPVVESSDSSPALNADEALSVRPEASPPQQPPVAQLTPPQKVKRAPERRAVRPALQQKVKSAPQAPIDKPLSEPKIKSASKTFGAKYVPRPQVKPAQLSKIVQKKKTNVAKAAAPQKIKSASLPEETQDYAGLVQYGGLAQRYYKELKCRSMTYEEIKRLYASVVVRHRAALSSYPRFEVKAILRAAKARADMANCS